jgi:hypothetical protein
MRQFEITGRRVSLPVYIQCNTENICEASICRIQCSNFELTEVESTQLKLLPFQYVILYQWNSNKFFLSNTPPENLVDIIN